ncbi:MAG: hypothetical protein C0454_17445 [Parvibaculum sp.]|nr:hypothetical protein [Parvibaculum sp.]
MDRWRALGFAVACCLPLALSPAAAQSAYLDAMEDMPLMDGLAETGESVVFDKPSGRILRSTAQGDVAPESVEAFYAETLPQLGWTRADEYEREGEGRHLVFTREGEQLDIQILPQAGGSEVRFSIEPR